jgi:hypothetical protein
MDTNIMFLHLQVLLLVIVLMDLLIIWQLAVVVAVVVRHLDRFLHKMEMVVEEVLVVS